MGVVLLYQYALIGILLMEFLMFVFVILFACRLLFVGKMYMMRKIFKQFYPCSTNDIEL